MLLKELEKLVNENIKLRNPNENKVNEYAEKMEAGVVFPPIIIGHWPKNEKYGDSGIVDGIHRLIAATQIKATEFPTETKKFDSLEAALTYMYQANMAHGLPVSDGQRNTRIRLLRQIDPKLDIVKMGKQFGLGKSSIDRIIKGEQGEGKSGPKGASKSKGQKSQDVLKPKQFFSMLERIAYTCDRVRPSAEIIRFATPESVDGVEIDTDKVALLQATIEHCKNLVTEIKKLG